MKKVIEGTITLEENYNIWSFESENKSYSDTVCEAIDQMLDDTTCQGEKYRIIIEKIG